MRRHQQSFFTPFDVAAKAYKRPQGDLTLMPSMGTFREHLLRRVVSTKRRGATTEELMDFIPDAPAQAVRQTLLELLEGGFIMESPARRKTRLGENATVWRTTDYGNELWRESKRK